MEKISNMRRELGQNIQRNLNPFNSQQRTKTRILSIPYVGERSK